MKTMGRKVLVLVALTAFAGSAVTASAMASAKSHKLTMKTLKAGPQVGTTISSTYTSTLLGKCSMKGKLVIPDTQQTITCKGGTFYLVAHSAKVGAVAEGTFKVRKGTGKFKGITGSGTFSGALSDNIFTYKGTLKY
jgi:hypothetical protein